MTISFAILVIIILFLYDFMFLRLLRNRKRRTQFSIFVDNGEIKKLEGDVTEKFYEEVRHLNALYKPGKIKISSKVVNKKPELVISGVVDDEYAIALEKAFKINAL